MEDIPILSREDPRNVVQLFTAHYDAPAYVRRARRVQDAFDQLIARCRQRREEWLELVRLRLGTLKARAGEWSRLRFILDGTQLSGLEELHDALQPRLRVPVESTSSRRLLRHAIGELRASLDRFNARWQVLLEELDLTSLNRLREDYNRYYLLEKECAMRSSRLARLGFQPLEPVTVSDVAELFPLPLTLDHSG
jgi:hypothetical protein